MTWRFGAGVKLTRVNATMINLNSIEPDLTTLLPGSAIISAATCPENAGA